MCSHMKGYLQQNRAREGKLKRYLPPFQNVYGQAGKAHSYLLVSTLRLQAGCQKQEATIWLWPLDLVPSVLGEGAHTAVGLSFARGAHSCFPNQTGEGSPGSGRGQWAGDLGATK